MKINFTEQELKAIQIITGVTYDRGNCQASAIYQSIYNKLHDHFGALEDGCRFLFPEGIPVCGKNLPTSLEIKPEFKQGEKVYCKGGDFVVLVTRNNSKTFGGTVIEIGSTQRNRKIGEHSEKWSKDRFCTLQKNV
jgi:hypothetical protein